MSSIDSIPSDLSEPETQSQLAWELMWGDPLRYDNVWLDRCSECPRLPIKVDLLNNPFKAVSSETELLLSMGLLYRNSSITTNWTNIRKPCRSA